MIENIAEKKEKRLFYNNSDSGLVYFLVLLVPQIVAVILMICVVLMNLSTDNIVFKIITVVLGQAIFLLIYIFFNKKNKIDFIKAGNIKFKLNIWQVLIAICLPIVCIFGFSGVISIVDEFLKFIGYNNPGELPLPINSIGWFCINVLLLAVIPAIVEELVFRGVVLNGLKKFGVGTAIILTAILFSLFHASPSQTVYQFILGVVLCYAAVVSGNLILPMIIHFINNFAVLLINYLYVNFGLDLTFSSNIIFVDQMFYVVSAVVGCFLVYLLFRGLRKCSSFEYQIDTPKEKISFAQNRYLFTGIIVAIAFWIIDLVY